MSTLGLDLDPQQPVGERTILHEPDDLDVRAERFSHSDDPEFTGNRGTRLSARTGNSGHVHDDVLPDLYVTDNGEVELGDVRMTTGTALAWFRAAAAHIEARTPAPAPQSRQPVQA